MRTVVNSRSHWRSWFVCVLAPFVLRGQSVPSTIHYQGRLTDNGTPATPVNAVVSMSFAIWDAPSGGTQLWVEPASGGLSVPVLSGIFNLKLGSSVPIPVGLFASGTSRYLEITINPGTAGAEVLAPRQSVATAPYAFHTENATNSSQLGGQGAAAYQARIAGACATGYAVAAVNPDGSVVCSPVASAYSAGAGLLLSGTQFSVDFAGTGTATTAARSDHIHALPVSLSVTKAGDGDGVLVSSPAGLSCGAGRPACTVDFPANTVLTLSATPDANSDFLGWSGACSGTGGCALTLSQSQAVGARFAGHKVTISVRDAFTAGSAPPSGAGMIFSDPPGFFCGDHCYYPFAIGQPARLNWLPPSDGSYSFQWLTGCSNPATPNVCSFYPAWDDTYWYTLRTRLHLGIGTQTAWGLVGGGGSISSSPAGASCTDAQSPCDSYQDRSATYSLTATPNPGLTAREWTTKSVNMATPQTVLVSFGWPVTYTNGNANCLPVMGSHAFGGQPMSCPYGAPCTTIGANNDYLDVLGVNANCAFIFLGWSGDCTGPNCTLFMNSAHTFTGLFNHGIKIDTQFIRGFCLITSTPAGLNCDGVSNTQCSIGAAPSATIKLKATPYSGHYLSSWSTYNLPGGWVVGADCTNSSLGTCTLTAPSTQAIGNISSVGASCY